MPPDPLIEGKAPLDRANAGRSNTTAILAGLVFIALAVIAGLSFLLSLRDQKPKALAPAAAAAAAHAPGPSTPSVPITPSALGAPK